MDALTWQRAIRIAHHRWAVRQRAPTNFRPRGHRTRLRYNVIEFNRQMPHKDPNINAGVTAAYSRERNRGPTKSSGDVSAT